MKTTTITEHDYRKELWIRIAVDKSKIHAGVRTPIKCANLTLNAFDATFKGEDK